MLCFLTASIRTQVYTCESHMSIQLPNQGVSVRRKRSFQKEIKEKEGYFYYAIIRKIVFLLRRQDPLSQKLVPRDFSTGRFRT